MYSKQLYDAGVTVGIAINLHPERVRNLRWEAAFAMEGGIINSIDSFSLSFSQNSL